MKIGVIIAEYNPFHQGHAEQIALARAAGVTHLAVVMSGQFVQRGDVALFSKWTRAKAAVLSGADLVVELPSLCALQPAREFAAAGVFLARQFPAATLFFGAETPDLPLLRDVSHAVEMAEQHPLFASHLATGVSHPKAREQTVSALASPQYATLLTMPNNLLALEYLRAITHQQSTLTPHPLPRVGAEHHATSPVGKIASASFIRDLCHRTSLANCAPYLPPLAFALYQQDVTDGLAPMRLERLERSILAHLRQCSPEKLRLVPGVTEGLEHRMLRCSREAPSLAECLTAITTKRYPTARIRRILLRSFLAPSSVPPAALKPSLPAYLRMLAMSERGPALLRALKAYTTLPITAQFSTIARHPHAIFESNASDLAALTSPLVLPAGSEFTTPLYRQK